MTAKHQHRGGSWWRSEAGDPMTRSSPAWAPEQSLTVTAALLRGGVWVLR
jgi:hypothetical protein